MKTIITGILLFGSLAFANSRTILLRSTTQIFFSPTPGTSTLTIDSDGKVEYIGPNMRFREGELSGVPLAQLTPQAVNNIKKQITDLDPEAHLIDENPDGPPCMDAPVTNMTAYQGGKEIRFYAVESCHVYNMEDGRGYGLAELMKGLENLTD